MAGPAAMLRTWDHENDGTVRVLQAIPERRLLLRPHARSRTLRDLAWHLVTSERWFCTGPLGLATKGGAPPENPPGTVAAMVAARERSHAARAAAARAKRAPWFAAEVEFYGQRMSRLEVLSLLLRHEAHHRGQLTVYLRLAGAKVPGVYGPSADEERSGPAKKGRRRRGDEEE